MKTAAEAITLRREGSVVVADFTKGELKDERAIRRLLEKLGDIIAGRSTVNLLLNMAHVTYISSLGLGTLVSLMKKTQRQGGSLKICCLGTDVREVFEVMQLTKILPIFDSEEAALASF
jgi:anti-anti-sigma factor